MGVIARERYLQKLIDCKENGMIKVITGNIMKIKLIYGYDYKEDVKILFNEYTQDIIDHEKSFEYYLKLQNYDDEINNLETVYSLPMNRLYLLVIDDVIAGSVVLKYKDDESCELKRLYVKREYRGNGYGYYLTNHIIKVAKEIGYKYMYLDTFAFLDKALIIYKKIGFYEIPKYNNNPIDHAIYMKLDL